MQTPEEIFFKNNFHNILKSAATKIQVNSLSNFPTIQAKINELTTLLIKKGAKGYFWLVASPEIITILEENANFYTDREIHIPLGTSDVIKVGLLDRKWTVFCSTQIGIGNILIGADYRQVQQDKYGLLTFTEAESYFS